MSSPLHFTVLCLHLYTSLCYVFTALVIIIIINYNNSNNKDYYYSMLFIHIVKKNFKSKHAHTLAAAETLSKQSGNNVSLSTLTSILIT